MGKQSARIFFQGKDHKDIYFNGYYHDKMYIGSLLVWEKIGREFVIRMTYIENNQNKLFIEDTIRRSVKVGDIFFFCGNDNRGDFSRYIYISHDLINWEKVGEIPDGNAPNSRENSFNFKGKYFFQSGVWIKKLNKFLFTENGKDIGEIREFTFETDGIKTVCTDGLDGEYAPKILGNYALMYALGVVVETDYGKLDEMQGTFLTEDFKFFKNITGTYGKNISSTGETYYGFGIDRIIQSPVLAEDGNVYFFMVIAKEPMHSYRDIYGEFIAEGGLYKTKDFNKYQCVLRCDIDIHNCYIESIGKLFEIIYYDNMSKRNKKYTYDFVNYFEEIPVFKNNSNITIRKIIANDNYVVLDIWNSEKKEDGIMLLDSKCEEILLQIYEFKYGPNTYEVSGVYCFNITKNRVVCIVFANDSVAWWLMEIDIKEG